MKGIIMSGESVPGVLSGRKGQTRRLGGLEVVNEEPGRWRYLFLSTDGAWTFHPLHNTEGTIVRCKPRYQVGETVYMKEAWRPLICAQHDEGQPPSRDWPCRCNQAEYPDGGKAGKWRSPLFMPQWASRAILRIERVRCERLQDISKRDAIAEGVTWSEAYPEGYTYPGCIRQSRGFGAAEHAYWDWWDAINKCHPWASNPWVFCYEFCKVQP